MKAFINQRFLNQTSFDSAAPAGSAVVAVELAEHGTYELALARKGKPFVFTNCRTGEGIDQVMALLEHDVLFDLP